MGFNIIIVCVCLLVTLVSAGGKDARLLLSARQGFFRLVVQAQNIKDYEKIVSGSKLTKNIKGLAYEPNLKFICWVKKRSVYRVQEEGKKITVLTKGPGEKFEVDDIDVDPYTGLMYWSRRQSRVIGVKRVDPADSPAYIVMSLQKGFKPTSIALYAEKGMMVFTNMLQEPRIETALMDGSGHKIIFRELYGFPHSIVIDKKEDKLYWTYSSPGQIEVANLDGSKRTIFLESPNILRRPIGGLTIQDHFLYWINKRKNRIERIDKRNITSHVIFIPPDRRLYNLLDMTHSKNLSWHPCYQDNGGCSHICFINPDKKKQCSCPLGMEFTNHDMKTCSDNSTCEPNQYKCHEGMPKCIHRSKQCDRVIDCDDGSDEKDCSYCSTNQFTCLNGKCIDRALVCDQQKHCQDGSDEANCTFFNFNNETNVIYIENNETISNISFSLNGYNKETSGNVTEKDKADTTAIYNYETARNVTDEDDTAPTTAIYNNETTRNVTDEDDTAPTTGIYNNETTRNVPDEDDTAPTTGIYNNETTRNVTDEDDTAPTSAIYYNKTTRNVTDEDDTAPTTAIYNNETTRNVTDEDDTAPTTGIYNNETTRNVTDEDDTTATTAIYNNETSRNVTEEVDKVNNSTLYNNTDNVTCSYDKFSCFSFGSCISRNRVCDGSVDCLDGSDEFNCSLSNTTDVTNISSSNITMYCLEFHFVCLNGGCIPDYWVCDCEIDCDDGSDEAGCPGLNTANDTNSQSFSSKVSRPDNRFICSNGDCIPKHWACDLEDDCGDFSDETNCSSPDTTASINTSILNTTVTPYASYHKSTTTVTCPHTKFMCSNGICIPGTCVCDRKNDCGDDSDEINCPRTCQENMFTCLNQRCIQQNWTCDFDNDCGDWSDENNCSSVNTTTYISSPSPNTTVTCKDNQFTCSIGECIPGHWVCDEENDCEDGLDELNCLGPITTPRSNDSSMNSTVECKQNEFTCLNQRCIQQNWICDFDNDCGDGSDEVNCSGQITTPSSNDSSMNSTVECKQNEFTCLNQRCIKQNWTCDFDNDCGDWSDETNCSSVNTTTYTSSPDTTVTCKDNQFKCLMGFCIPGEFHCDRVNDCWDGSDEVNCTVTCKDNQFTCSSGECIPGHWVCDEQNDCEDGLDELNCLGPITTPRSNDSSMNSTVECKQNEFTCLNQRCIQQNWICDFDNDCGDGSDEVNCSGQITTPSSNDSSMNSTVECKQNEFTCLNQRCIQQNWICDFDNDCGDGSDEVNCSGQITTPRSNDSSMNSTVECKQNEFTCLNQRCIQQNWICDFADDCGDGSDEVNCSGQITTPRSNDSSMNSTVECKQNEFTCLNQRCILQNWICDFDNDCGDGSDEVNCSGQITTPRSNDSSMNSTVECKQNEFTCLNQRCILQNWICDFDNDCGDGSDEVNCSGQITTPRSNDSSMNSTVECKQNEFTCLNQRCILQNWICDFADDCGDGSDEVNCSGQITTPRSNDSSMNSTVECKQNEFTCLNQRCIKQNWICDFDNDCGDGSDEVNCSGQITTPRSNDSRMNSTVECKQNEFTCLNQRCILQNWICDFDNDCGDGSDEVNCSGQITTPRSNDSSMNSTVECKQNEFTCLNQRCILQNWICDFADDCGDGSDEVNCSGQRTTPRSNDSSMNSTVECKQNEFTCLNQRCIQQQLLCDLYNDCGDWTDETNCSSVNTTTYTSSPSLYTTVTCKDNQFTCSSGKCILELSVCDGQNDCEDRSDEDNCLDPVTTPSGTKSSENIIVNCNHNEFTCFNQRCIPEYWVCDLEDDCDDGSDENNCSGSDMTTYNSPISTKTTVTCSGNELMCSNGNCIPLDWICDHTDDCGDASEEANCTDPKTTRRRITSRKNNTVTCLDTEFNCFNQRCISQHWVCDLDDDCGDGSDEANCPNSMTAIYKTSSNYNTTGNCIEKEFTCLNGECIPSNWVCNLENDCGDLSDETNCSVPDNTTYNTMSSTYAIVMCSESDFECLNRKCVTQDLLCDGSDDCGDLSDETNCPVPVNTTYNNNMSSNVMCSESDFKCLNRKCVTRDLLCDGSDDCGDLSDETNCPHLNTTLFTQGADGNSSLICSSSEFTCTDQRCVNLDQVCNGQNDCRDGLDETNCTLLNNTVVDSSNGSMHFLNSNDDIDMNPGSSEHTTNEPAGRRTTEFNKTSYNCTVCTHPVTSESIVHQYCEADVVMKAMMINMIQVEGDIKLNLQRRKALYKHSGMSQKEAKNLTAVIKDGASCSCERIKGIERSKYLLMGIREGNRLVLTYGVPLDYRNRGLRMGIKAMGRKNICV